MIDISACHGRKQERADPHRAHFGWCVKTGHRIRQLHKTNRAHKSENGANEQKYCDRIGSNLGPIHSMMSPRKTNRA